MPVYDRSGGRSGSSGGCRANSKWSCGDPADSAQPANRASIASHRDASSADSSMSRPARWTTRRMRIRPYCEAVRHVRRHHLARHRHASAAPPRRGGDVVDRHRRQFDGTRGPRRCSSAGRRRFAATPRRGVGDVRRRRTRHRPPGARLGRRSMVDAGRCQPITGSAGRGRSTDRPCRRGRGGRPAASAGRSPSPDWAGAARPRSDPQASFGDLTEGEASVGR